MTGYECLDKLNDYRVQIEEQELYIEELKLAISGMTGISYDRDSVQTSAPDNPMLNQIIKVDDAELTLKALKQQYAEHKIQCIDIIHMMLIANHKKVLRSMYIEGKTIQETAEAMKLSYDYIRKLHKSALSEFENIYNFKSYKAIQKLQQDTQDNNR